MWTKRGRAAALRTECDNSLHPTICNVSGRAGQAPGVWTATTTAAWHASGDSVPTILRELVRAADSRVHEASRDEVRASGRPSSSPDPIARGRATARLNDLRRSRQRPSCDVTAKPAGDDVLTFKVDSKYVGLVRLQCPGLAANCGIPEPQQAIAAASEDHVARATTSRPNRSRRTCEDASSRTSPCGAPPPAREIGRCACAQPPLPRIPEVSSFPRHGLYHDDDCDSARCLFVFGIAADGPDDTPEVHGGKCPNRLATEY